MKYHKPIIISRKINDSWFHDGWFRGENGTYHIAPGYKLVPKPLKKLESALDYFAFKYESYEYKKENK